MTEFPNEKPEGKKTQPEEKKSEPVADFQQGNSDTIEKIFSCYNNIHDIESELKYFSGRKKKIAEDRIKKFAREKNEALDELIAKIAAAGGKGMIPSDEELLLATETEKRPIRGAKRKMTPEEANAVERKSNFFKFLDENLDLGPYICSCVEDRLVEIALEKKRQEVGRRKRESTSEASDQVHMEQVRKKINDFPEAESEIVPFDPEEEVEKIRQEILTENLLSPEEKKEKKFQLKEKIPQLEEESAAQKIGMAEINHYLEKKATNSNQIDLRELRRYFQEKAEKYKLAPFQVERYNLLFEKAGERIALLEDYDKRFDGLSGKETFKMMFGFEPEEEVEIERRGLCFCVYCSSAFDYAKVYAGEFQGELKKRLEKTAHSTGGCADIFTVLPELQGAIVAIRGNKEDDYQDKAAIHEEKHILNNMAATVQVFDKRWYLKENDKATEEEKIRFFFNAGLNRIRERAGDEILAFLKSGEHPSEILRKLEASKEEGGIYDYLAGKDVFSLPDEYRKEHLKDKRKELQELASKKYRADIRAATKCLLKLDNFGFSPDIIISIFQTENLESWPKVFRRLMKTENFKSALKGNVEKKLEGIGKAISRLEDNLSLLKGRGAIAKMKEWLNAYDSDTASAIQNIKQELAVLKDKQSGLLKVLTEEK